MQFNELPGDKAIFKSGNGLIFAFMLALAIVGFIISTYLLFVGDVSSAFVVLIIIAASVSALVSMNSVPVTILVDPRTGQVVVTKEYLAWRNTQILSIDRATKIEVSCDIYDHATWYLWFQDTRLPLIIARKWTEQEETRIVAQIRKAFGEQLPLERAERYDSDS